MNEITLKIDGMHCDACVRRVTQTLQKVTGVEVEEVRVGTGRIHAADASTAQPAAIAALEKAGYPARAES